MAASTRTVKAAPTDEQADAKNPALAEVDKSEPPAGMPTVLPLHALPRARRAVVLRLLAPVVQKMTALKDAEEQAEAQKQPDKVLLLMADVDELLDEAAKALAAGANSPDRFAAWADKQDSTSLFGAVNWYMGTLQPGEADSSQ